MTNKKYKSISISNLIINPDNDRFESVENEKQAIDIMLTKLGDKIYYIAIHILENGLSPKPFYVMPSKKSNKKFLVKEGNRRTTALKLMANPKLIDSKKHASLKNRFFKLHERFMETPIRKIMCYIYDDVEEADKWVRLEHTGEQNGVGIVEWKPEQVQRFDIGEFYQFNLSSCIRQQNSLTAQFVSFNLSNLANIFYPPPNFYNN